MHTPLSFVTHSRSGVVRLSPPSGSLKPDSSRSTLTPERVDPAWLTVHVIVWKVLVGFVLVSGSQFRVIRGGDKVGDGVVGVGVGVGLAVTVAVAVAVAVAVVALW
ncbi:MAG: hypothetical protein M3217_13085, partial [Actinomycetota bacterium]|nr:hypothetical protein [Actinomycetota bacterium]